MNERAKTLRSAGLGGQLGPAALPYIRRWVVAGAALATIGYLVSILERLITGELFRIETEVAAVLGSAVGLVLAVRGRVRAAGLLVLAVVWAELVSSLAMDNPSLAWYSEFPVFPVLVVATGLFFGGTAALVVAVVSSVAVPLAIAGAYALHGVAISSTTFPTYPLTILAATMIGSAVLVWEGLRTFDTAQRSHAAEASKYALLVRDAPFGVVLLDQAGRLEALNPAAADLLGISEQEGLGRRLSELLGPVSAQAASLVSGLDDVGSHQELTLLLPGGRRFVELSGRPTILADGGSGSMVMLRDVTAHRELERHLVQLGRMLDRAPYEVYVFDADTLHIRFTNVAARQALGYLGAELEDLTISDVLPELTRGDVRRLVTDLSGRPDEVVAVAGRHRRKDGTTYPVEARLHLVSFADESAIGLFAIDVSARVAAEDAQERLRSRMEQAQQFETVQQLAGGIAHEFNNLLMSVGGHAEMIAEFSGEDRVREWAGRIRAAQERGAALIQRLQGLARTDVAQPSSFSLGEALREFLPVLEHTLGPTVHVALEAGGRDVVTIDRGQLEQIVLHLATNARDAMPAGGTVRIVVRGPAPGAVGDVEMDVRDTGRGMSPETVRRAFDPFFTDKPHGRGTGLGLTAVRSIVTQAGGQVELESTPAAGTIARLRLPASSAQQRPPFAAPVAAPAPGESGPSGDILVVEDDADSRAVVAHALTHAGYQVRAVATAEEALAWAAERQGDVDLVLTDIALPGMTGFALGTEIAARFAPLRVLYMSGYAQQHIEGAPPGFDPAADLLVKPFSADTLLTAVRNVLRRPPEGIAAPPRSAT